jgi:hypothetical protein
VTPKVLALGLAQGRLAVGKQKAQMREFLCPVGLSAEEVSDTLPRIHADLR